MGACAPTFLEIAVVTLENNAAQKNFLPDEPTPAKLPAISPLYFFFTVTKEYLYPVETMQYRRNRGAGGHVPPLFWKLLL